MKFKVDLKEQRETPYIKAYEKYLNGNFTVFDVPGHHQGGIVTDFDKIFTHIVYEKDVNCPEGMDNIMHPHECIKEAQILFAKACGADKARFLINGSTGGILTMLMSALSENDKIILPRNVHKSVINGLILTGAIPVFINPEVDKEIGIVNQISFNEWKKVIDDNLDAKAIFIINPTYFGATCDLKTIVEYAHSKNIIVLVDEAHGSHFYFNDKLPCTAMEAEADMATLSIHKTGGSLTQSSVLLIKGKRIDDRDIEKAFNILNTTSPSSLLLASLDAARKFMVFKGEKEIDKAIELCALATKKINSIKGFRVKSKEDFLNNGSYSFDLTKLVVGINSLSVNGFKIYKILQKEYHIQIELAETNVFLCLFTIGSTKEDVDILCHALKEISNKYYIQTKYHRNSKYFNEFSRMVLKPRDAYNAELDKVKLEDALGRVSRESIMIYPPGIPIIIPGEEFTKDIIDEIQYYKKKKCNILSENPECDFVNCIRK